MTSASAFDKFTFSAENTDEEYSIDEPIEVDTAIEDKQEEKKIKEKNQTTTKLKRNRHLVKENYKPYVKKSILTEDFLPILPMAKLNDKVKTTSNGKEDTKQTKKSKASTQPKIKENTEIKNGKKGEKDKTKQENTTKTSGKKTKAIKNTITESKIEKNNKLGKKISTTNNEEKIDSKQNKDEKLNKIKGGKVNQNKNKKNKQKGPDPAQKIWEEYCNYQNQVTLTLQEITKLLGYKFKNN